MQNGSVRAGDSHFISGELQKMAIRRADFSVGFIVAVMAAMAVGMGCTTPASNGSARGNGNANRPANAPSVDLAALATDLRAEDAGTRQTAIETAQTLDETQSARLLDIVRQSDAPVPAPVGETLGQSASAAGRHRVAAEWLALPVPEDSAESRGRRLVKAIGELIAGEEFALALQLCEIRLAGPYPAEIEADLAALRERAEAGWRAEN